ncbi:DUF402 domain-containing protein [Deinococcus multiflagellatus]|uniref:DUF402 domain-containing protein n=1 Tax=Deinococcus multiflagellatus TaxID=1656887 RepID=A0ABW1ZMZ9_9DEIO|nr:DUF402 domain-containing protein [Deinococcus multiflagellatus]MBZ9714756.1 DUF402 domain-containing protein [Deinococcus multiflagellatus]
MVTLAPPAAHPVKVERHDVPALRHHTNTGVRAVQTYRETAGGLYVSRPFVGHPRVRHWQAHLLPALNLVVCRYDFHGEREHDYHLDVADIWQEGAVWVVRDLYLDLLVHDGLMAEIVDTDELLAARAAGYLTEPEMHHAVAMAHRTLSGLARARYDLQAWLAGQGLWLEWAQDRPAGVAEV